MAMVMVFLVCLTMRCNPDEESGGGKSPDVDPLRPQPAVTTTVSGVIVDENGQPVEDAEIMVHGETAFTGRDGTFYLKNIQVPGNRCIVQSRKDGYFTGTRALTPDEHGKTETRIVLMANPVTHTFEASSGSTAALSDGSEVRIPANGLVSDAGTPYNGPVNMSVRYLDPTAQNFGVLVPGGDMVARREDQSTSILYSYGILRVEMKDPSGSPLQLAPGSTSTLVMNIPAEQLSTAPHQIPLWYFDEESGVWQEEGFATREGNRYIGAVTHFTDWNCDAPTEGATIIGRLVDCEDNAAYGIVEFGQTTSDPQSSTETGESDGRFSRRVPSGVQITVIISDPLVVTPLTKNERGKVIVIVPPLSPGQIYDVGDIQTFPCPSHVTATFKTREGDQVESISFSSENGIKGLYDPGPALHANLPAALAVTMIVTTRDGITVVKNIQTAAAEETLDLGEIDLSSSLQQGQVQIIGKTECYGDAEGQGQINVYWNDGGLNSGINYSSPNPDGTFMIQAPPGMSVEVTSSTPRGTWKKVVQTPSAAGQVLDLGTIEICENVEVGETSFRVTGDGMDGAIFNIVSNKNWAASNMGVYYPLAGYTLVLVDDLESDIALTVWFPGNDTGQKTQLNEVVISIQRTVGNSTTYYWAGITEEDETLELEITKYGDVGGVIEGVFSGTFYLQNSNQEFTGETVKITDGKFSVVRHPDVG